MLISMHNLQTGNLIDDYAKYGGPEVVWHLCSFYQDPLQL